MEIYTDLIQGTQEWLKVRAGMPTSSCFSDVIAKVGPRGGKPKGRQTYLWKLAGEILTGEPMDSYSNRHMERGKEREEEARALYSLMTGNETQQIGFIRNGNCGASPDSLVGDNAMLELKDALAHIQIERLLDGCLPSEHKPQVQGQLMVAERERVDFVSHCRNLPLLVVPVYRDEPYIKALRADVDAFVDELQQLTEYIGKMQ